MRIAGWWILIVAAVSASLQGRVYSPRVLSPHHADTYSLKTFAEFQRWRDLQGDAKVWEVFRYLVDSRTGLYPMGVPAFEGDEELPEFSAVRDPIKMLNVYPIGHCGTLGPTVAGIMEGMGIGPSRTLVLPGWNHVAAETFYEGGWHYLDLDVRAVFRRADGSLASMENARREASLWTGPIAPWFFPLDSLAKVREVYAQTPVQHYYGFFSGGHTMDYVLRQGETFTRWWRPQGGRWNHHPSYGQAPFPRSLLTQEPRGPKSKHPSFTVHTHGNGRFLYRPNLTARSSDFQDGAEDTQNVAPGLSGLTLVRAGMGYAVFEVASPYVIVPQVGDLDAKADDREASVVEIESVGATLSISLDQGRTWKEVGGPSGVFDLTSQVSGTYGYLLKVVLRGEPERAVVRSLAITTWVQLHPASLPSLRLGRNEMRLVSGDHYGLPTRRVEIHSQAGKPEEFLKYLTEPPRDYDPARRTSRVRGSVTVPLEAPRGERIAWFSAGASFATHQKEAALATANTMAYALDAPREWVEFYRARMPKDQGHWHYNADQEVRFKTPATSVYVRFHGDPGLNNFRIAAHLLEDRAHPVVLPRVTHVWMEGGTRKNQTVTLRDSDRYEIVCAAEPTDESIELAIPSQLRP